MSSQHRLPSVEVLGLYSLAADHARYIRFLQEKLASEDSTNLDDEERPLTEEERAELEAALRLNMGDAVMIEAVVSHADASFDVGAFAQPDPALPESNWQVAWNERFLTADGDALLNERPWEQPPNDERLRLVFVIHFWKPDLPLQSSYGQLALPPIQPLPERLWRLAPYELP
jgi:hypothetical protein